MCHTALCDLLAHLPVRLSIGSEQGEPQILVSEGHPIRAAFEKLCREVTVVEFGRLNLASDTHMGLASLDASHCPSFQRSLASASMA